MEEIAGLDVLAVDHVGIAVPDLDAATAFYTETMGGRVEHREHNDDQGIDEAMIVFDGSASAARIQLIAPATPDCAIATFLDRNGPGLQQMAVRVPDVAVAADRLRARGLRLLYDAPRRGTADSRINFVHPKDAGGVLIELVQPATAPRSHGADDDRAGGSDGAHGADGTEGAEGNPA